ncbi:phosphate acetyltransferase [Coccomyxa sp. Obi]|nr:phosphate acetyltransferase [Coccomyxa sp. Obi]
MPKETGHRHGLPRLPPRMMFSSTAEDSHTSKKSLYVVNVEGKRTLAPLLIGLLDYFERWVPNVGFFQPLGGMPFPDSDSKEPRHVELVRKAFNLKDDPRSMYAVERREAINLLAHDKADELLDRMYSSFEAYQAKHDLVVIEGTHEDGKLNVPGNRLELNGRIAATLASPVLMVLDASEDISVDDLVDKVLLSKNGLEEQRCEVLGLIVNKAPLKEHGILRAQMSKKLTQHNLPLVGVLPHDPLISSVRLDEIQAALNAKLIAGQKGHQDLTVDKVHVATADLDTTLRRLTDLTTSARPLVVTDIGRSDLILGLTSANESTVGPHVTGILCTNSEYGRRDMSPHVHAILQAKHMVSKEQEDAGLVPFFPVMSTDNCTWDAVTAISSIQPSIRPTSKAKIEEAKALFQKYVEGNLLVDALEAEREFVMTPKMFMHNINRICLSNRQRVVLPESEDPRVLAAGQELTQRGLADIVLLGEPEKVTAQARRLNIDISQCKITDPEKSDKLEAYVEKLVEARRKKNVTPDMARDLLHDPNYFGTMMTLCGDADGMVSGAMHTTAATIRPGLQVLRTKDSPLVSSVFFMCLPDKVLIYGDCAVNVHPSSNELAQIAVTSADTAAAFGVEPRVALLSYSTFGSGSGPEVDRVAEAVRIAKEMRPDLKLEGPIQYDAAVDPVVARQKVKGHSEVAGKATVLIFPSLEAGNNTYKAVQQSTGAIAIGPILQGLSRPVNDLSRGCTVVDIINTVTCTCVQAVAIKDREKGSHAAAPAA